MARKKKEIIEETVPCEECQKNEEIKELPLVEEVINTELIVTPDDLKKVWAHLHEPKTLSDEGVESYVKNVYKVVTDKELNIAGCYSCKRTSILNPFKWYANHKYGVELR